VVAVGLHVAGSLTIEWVDDWSTTAYVRPIPRIDDTSRGRAPGDGDVPVGWPDTSGSERMFKLEWAAGFVEIRNRSLRTRDSTAISDRTTAIGSAFYSIGIGRGQPRAQ